MRKTVIVRGLLVALVVGVLTLGHIACGGGGYDSPTSPGTTGTPPPGATPTPPRY